MSLAARQHVPELMDDPSLDEASHRQALRGLRRVNYFSLTGKQLADAIIRVAHRRRLPSIRVLDLGCGSGDVLMNIARRVNRTPGFSKCHFEGWDMSPTAVATASAEAERCSFDSETASTYAFERRDVLVPSDEDDSTSFDFVYCSLFLHHFSDESACDNLRLMRRLARHAVFVDDLLRTRVGLILAQLGCRILSSSRIVHVDGPRSVRAAFSPADIQRLAERADLMPHDVARHWPERFLLSWERPIA